MILPEVAVTNNNTIFLFLKNSSSYFTIASSNPIVESEYIYDGMMHNIVYEISDLNGVPYSVEDIYVSSGDELRYAAGEYVFVLEVLENNYFSKQVIATLKINKKLIDFFVETFIICISINVKMNKKQKRTRNGHVDRHETRTTAFCTNQFF